MEDLQQETETENRGSEKNQTNLLHMVIDIVETLVISFALFFGINTVSARIRVDGTSMEPSLHNGEFVLVNKLAYRFGKPHLGDVIVFHYPRDPKQEYIKRVIGVPGDKIEIAGGQVYVNGFRLTEPYIAAPPNYSGSWSVPEGSLFVLGDNRNNSSDSHSWGYVPYNYMIGKSVLVYWPPDQWSMIEHISIALP